jgi:hypothetical protein
MTITGRRAAVGGRPPERIGAPAGVVERQEPGVAVELLERRDPGADRRRLGRGHEARQAEVSRGD